ncbi:dTDP-4-dehydrorhamnose reductase [Photobacterium leiognathi]|uniref:dTDP-4-dehydrorhamnose reductase n=1 Tax=Photobacterium leiognathi TaxID=553611 RepID=UPI002980DF63|nr:dTDP-4-dehydrorhamnose reductase [Photobacterium leiognathi]
MIKILITGKGGQLAWELEKTCPSQYIITCLDSVQLDITKRQQVFDSIAKIKPDIVINAAAYTAVDNAETDQTTAYAVNATGCEYIAQACKEHNAELIHISTDFVFDGDQSIPYQTDNKPNPINVYGASKLQGEITVSDILGSHATIIRTAWVYSAHGNNFVKSMLRLMVEKDQLGIVYDQVGTPTWAKGLAVMIWSLINKKIDDQLDHAKESHLLHWTDAGVASWYDFAIAIQELALEKGLLKVAIPIKPISSSAYPTAAKRPCFSVIDKLTAEKHSGVDTMHWRKQLSTMLDELKTQS